MDRCGIAVVLSNGTLKYKHSKMWQLLVTKKVAYYIDVVPGIHCASESGAMENCD